MYLFAFYKDPLWTHCEEAGDRAVIEDLFRKLLEVNQVRDVSRDRENIKKDLGHRIEK